MVDARNQREDEVVVVPISTRGEPGPTRVAVRRGVGGLEHDSVLFCEETTAMHVEFLNRGPLGQPVPESLLRSVVRGVRIALGDVPMPGD